MNFETALRLLKAGHTIRWPLWDDKETFLQIKYPNKKYPGYNGKIVKLCRWGSETDWIPKSEELLSNNWICLDSENFYDQGHDDGFKEGYDLALEKYLEYLNATCDVRYVKEFTKIIEDIQSK